MKTIFVLAVVCILGASSIEVDKTKWEKQECKDGSYDYSKKNMEDVQKCYAEHEKDKKACVSKCVGTALGILDKKDSTGTKEVYLEWVKHTLPSHEALAVKNGEECFKAAGIDTIKAEGNCEKMDEIFKCFRKPKATYTC